MKRTSLLVALLVVVGMLVVPAAGVLAQETDDGNEAEEIAPGERLSGVVGVQQAEFDGEIERNAFRIALDRADDNAKASHIAEKLNQSEGRLAELNERKTELREQRENGDITEGKYRAQMAKTVTEIENTRQQLDQSNETAAQLPAETLEANGVNTTAIRTLMNNASEMSGGEVSEIARSIAGDRSGMVDRGAAGDRGPGEDRGGDRSPGDDNNGDAADQRPNGDKQAPNGTETDGGDDRVESGSGADSNEDTTDSDDSDADRDGGSAGSGGANAGNAGNR